MGARLVRSFIVVFAGCATALVLACAVLSYNGFCFKEKRFLSDRDYFASAVSEIIERNAQQLITQEPGGTLFRSVPVIKYAGAGDFHRKNPNCCKVVADDVANDVPPTSFDQRLFGYIAKFVVVTYVVNYLTAAGDQKSEKKTEYFAVTNCGHAWNGIS